MNDGILKYTLRRIRFKAGRLVGTHGFVEDDFKDLCQDLMQDVLRRLPRFDGRRADLKIFISTVIDHRIATLIEGRQARCRDYRREERSLDEPAVGKNLDYTTFGEGLTEEHARLHLGRAGRSDREKVELAMDVAAVLEGLDDEERRLCRLLQEKTPSQIARETGVRRAGIYERLARIRKKFIEAGLDGYL